jgi:holliday junction DNA helicase RuvA
LIAVRAAGAAAPSCWGTRRPVGHAQGVGLKLATRIVTELKDKAPSMMLRGNADDATVIATASPIGPEPDAVAALVKLGYTPRQAAEAVARSAREFAGAPTEVLLRESLRGMAR